MFGDKLYDAFGTIKRTFDPEGILNPGKIVDAPPITENLRFGAGYKTPDPETYFDYSDYGGMGGAVEMCSGSAHAARSSTAQCVRPTWPHWRKRTAREAAPTCCVWQ